MILYHVDSQYQLLCAMIHQLQQGEEADIIVHDMVMSRFKKRQILDIARQFRDIIAVDPFFRYRNTKERTDEYYSKKLNVADYAEIYVWGAHRSFGYYLAENKIPFVFCEEALGFLSRPDILIKRDRKIAELKNYYQSVRKYGLYDGTGGNIQRRILNFEGQVKDFQPREDDINFDVARALATLPEEKRKRLLRIFVENGEIELPEKANIFLTEHFSFLNRVTFEEHILLTQMFVDYFLQGRRLVIKPHPNDVIYYGKLFPEAKVIRQSFPAELFSVIFNPQPAGLATISSSVVRSLKKYYSDIAELTPDYVNDYRSLHRYYVAVSIARNLKMPIYCWEGTNRAIVKGLLEADKTEGIEILEEMSETCVIIVDRMTANQEDSRKDVVAMLKMLNRMQRLASKICVVFINTEKDFCWYSYEQKCLWEHMAPLVLLKCKMQQSGSDFYADMEQETMYVFSCDKEILKMAKETEIKKELPHVGLSFTTACLPQNEETIKMLEGVLAATERRLLYYIEKEKQERNEN